jgi:enediyne biosynthesis protein E4
LRNNSGHFQIDLDAIPPNQRNNVGGRSIAVFDYNDDGLLDLFIAQDRFEGGQSILLRNKGGFRYVDATASAGLPTNIEGFGVSAKDLTGDGHGDLYVVGSNRLFISKGNGTFREVGAKAAGLVRPAPDPDRPKVDFDTGVSVGDVNRDGRPDVAVAEHYASAAIKGRKIPAVSLYLNKGLNSKGNPIFEDVTTQAGLPSVASRSADVNINDYDNDGWPDLAAGVAVSKTRPAVFRSLGLSNGVPKYAVPAGVGEVKGTAEPGDQSHYGLPVAAADYDKDGRLDIFYDFFFSNVDGQLLLRNETGSGHWLALSLGRALGGGIGAKVSVYRAGALGDPNALIGQREIAATDGYTAGVPDEAHFGLGTNAAVEVRVTLPPGSRGLATIGVIELKNVPADRHLRLPTGCGGA